MIRPEVFLGIRKNKKISIQFGVLKYLENYKEVFRLEFLEWKILQEYCKEIPNK